MSILLRGNLVLLCLLFLYPWDTTCAHMHISYLLDMSGKTPCQDIRPGEEEMAINRLHPRHTDQRSSGRVLDVTASLATGCRHIPGPYTLG